MATMADVARLAGVSTATVSHVLNGTRPVKDATVAAVREAIRRAGYTPNSLARSLARASSSMIGVAVSAITNHYFSDVIGAVEAACRKQNFMMLLSDTLDDPEHQLRVVQELHQRRVDGIILAGVSGGSEDVLHYLRTNRVAAVLIDRLISNDFDQVGVENARSTAELVRHLVGHGHRRIGFIAGKSGLTTSDERLDGFRLGLREAALPESLDLVEYGQSTVEGGRAALHRLIERPVRPTALVTGNNLMTIGALSALREAGLRVPEDVALAGFDNFDWAEFAIPSLTVMAQPASDIGGVAVDLLMRRLQDPMAPKRTIRLAPKLVIRTSCGCCSNTQPIRSLRAEPETSS
jgi:LacI family transcriptional regulator